MNLTNILIWIRGNASQYLQTTRQVMAATTHMSNHVIGQVQRMAGAMGSFGAGANWGGGGGFGGFASSMLRGLFHGGIAGLGAAAVLGPVVMTARGISNAIDTITDATKNAVRETIRLGVEFEKVRTAYEVFTGSKTVGRQLFGQIQQLGIQTPYTAQQLSERGQMLLGYGVQPGQLVPTLSRLGDIAAGDPNRLGRLSLAYGQVLSHGRMQGQELRQFAEAGVGAEDFAKTLGITGREFKDMVSAGMVGADVMIKTLNRLTNEGGRFYRMNQEQLKTIHGSWNALVETVTVFLGKVGFGAMERLGVAAKLREITASLGDMNNLGERVIDWVTRFASGLAPVPGYLRAAKDELTSMFTGAMNIEDVGKKMAGGIKEALIFTLQFIKGLEIAYVRMQMIGEALTPRVTERPIRPGEMQQMNWYERQMTRLWNAIPDDPWFGSKAIQNRTDLIGRTRGAAWTMGLPPDHPLRKEQDRLMAEQAAIRGNIERGAKQPFVPRLQDVIARRNAERLAGTPVGEIATGYAPSINAMQAMQLGGGIYGGGSPYQRFLNLMSGINEAYPVGSARALMSAVGAIPGARTMAYDLTRHQMYAPGRGWEGIIYPGGTLPPRQDMLSPHRLLSGAQLGGLGPMAAQIIGAALPGVETKNKYATYQAFQQLAGAVRHGEVPLPPAYARGTSEAQDTINRSMMAQTSIQEEIREILREANRLHQLETRYMEELFNEMQLQRSQGGFVVPGSIGPGGN